MYVFVTEVDVQKLDSFIAVFITASSILVCIPQNFVWLNFQCDGVDVNIIKAYLIHGLN